MSLYLQSAEPFCLPACLAHPSACPALPCPPTCYTPTSAADVSHHHRDNSISQTDKAQKAILEEIGRELCKVGPLQHTH